MTRRDITRLFVKFFGLIILLLAVIPLPIQISAFIGTVYALEQNSLVMGASKSGYTWQTVAVIVTSLFLSLVIKVAVGLCFIRWSGFIADKVGRAPEKDEIVEAPDLRNIEIVLFAVLGLYFIADGFADLCRWVLTRGFRYSASGSLSLIWEWDIPFLVGTLVELIIGILLVLGRGGSAAVRQRVHAWVLKWRTWPD